MAKKVAIGGKVYTIVADAAFTQGEINKAKARLIRLKSLQVNQ